jgi:hypothetical protein
MKRRLKRVFLLATVGFIGKAIRKRFLQKQDAGSAPSANPTAAPFEAQVQGDSVRYEATNPVDRDPKDPAEPFGGEPQR